MNLHLKRIFCFTLFIPFSAVGQVNLTLGLKAFYPFSGNANDVSGNNNNPVFNNATLTTDRFGTPASAYHFNGNDNYIQVPNSPSLNPSDQISLVAWVKPMGFYYGACHGNSVIMKGDDADFTGRYVIRYDDGQYVNFNNCSITIPDTIHENYWGAGAITNGGYTPYVMKDQWVCVIYTYDGTRAKIYLNCQLVLDNIAPAYTFTNPYDLFIGKANVNMTAFPYWFNGDLDDIRIYDRALNEEEVNVLAGCPQPDSLVINDYTPVIALNPCENKITVEDAGTFNTGDTVFMIQMKGAVIDSTNTAAFGTITDYKNAGNYEFNYVKSKTGNIIELKNKLTRQYDIPAGKVQLIRVPYYPNINIDSTLTCLPWDGNKGGVLVLNVLDTINLHANIDVSGKGFRGAIGFNPQNTTLNCFQNNYNYPISSNADAAQKGESIASISQNIICGKGSPAGGGGGGLGHNSGGGGGANGSAGGFGGYQLEPCGNAPFDNRGIGGHALTYNTATNKIYMGGGGGAGQADNAGNLPSGGGNGAGIIILLSNYLKSNSYRIQANGIDGEACTIPPSAECHDGMGGGGAGGTILISVNQLLDNSITEDRGGKGADMIGSVPLGGRIGSGGGGSGGVLFLKNNSLPGNLTNVNTGGPNGVLTQDGNSSWGATPGQDGIALFNLAVPFDDVLFTPNIDSVRIKDSTTGCSSFDFKGLGYTNFNPVTNWQWNFGDGATANAQNTSHVYLTNGTFPVKLTIIDINGCIDSISKDVISSSFVMDAGPADTICASASVVLQANTTGANQFAWTPATWLNDSTLLNPTATPPGTTTFYLTAMNTQGCSKTDSVVINIRAANTFSVNPPVSICKNDSTRLLATGGDLYSWTPGNSNLPDPLVFPPTTSNYSVLITDTVCGNSTTLSTMVTVLPLPIVHAGKSNDIDCSTPGSQLSVSGAAQYSWTPAPSLTNPNSVNPIATPAITTLYTVKGSDAAGCINYDTVTVNVLSTGKGGYLMPTAFTPNNDGLNDCYGIKYWGTILELDFSIYNRWGERIFHTKQPAQCWDGTYKGIKLSPDVFVYMIRAKTFCQSSVFRKGTFTLIR